MDFLELLEKDFNPEIEDVTPEENCFLLDNSAYRCPGGYPLQ